MDEVPADAGVIFVVNLAAQGRHHPVIDLVFAEVAKRLDESAAFPPGGGHVARSGVLEDDLALADFHLAGGTVGEKDDAGRNLLGEPQDIRRVGSGRLESNCVTHHKGAGDGVGGWRDGAQDRILNRVIIEPAGQQADSFGRLQSPQRRVDRGLAPQVLKMLRSEHPTPAVAENPATDRQVNGLGVLGHLVLTEKLPYFSVKTRFVFMGNALHQSAAPMAKR